MTLRRRALMPLAAFLILAGCDNVDTVDIAGGTNYTCQANLRDSNGHGPLVTEKNVNVSASSVDKANALCTTGLTSAAIAQDKIATQNGVANTDYVPGCSCDEVTTTSTGHGTRLPTAP